MLLDEPSMGLAPSLVQEIFEIVGRLNRGSAWRCCWPSRRQHGAALRSVRLRDGERAVVLDGDVKT